MQSNEHDFSSLPPEYIALAVEWQQATPERRAQIEQEQRQMLQPKASKPVVKPYSPEWVKGIVKHEGYTAEDYRRFQEELKRRKKTGLVQMMQQLLKQKFNR
ncbi:hypothetical protein C8N40_11190 [Pontibacter mucosus]|uniref:Uncharacterized protein n=1 Tax=Pontibacter mucosus TaxID=1649266 RepID=A0A2T5YD45_9BACT|nr:hypothetical protein [Pontibacter mucosus]PTX14425.1 hypothetical protein C8N40_11190 [Pontibacter mucosus]